MEEKNIQIKDKLSGFLGFKPNFLIQALNDCPAKVIGIFTGNQHGKTSTVVKHYIDRILGMCPIEEKNMRPNTQIRTIRFASETLPMEAGAGGEVRNTVYPQLKKFLPYELIKKDITIRKPVMTIKDPQGGRDIFAEFVSYNQEVQSQAGVQRWSIYMDEEPKRTFYDEQIPRLLSANGDIIIGMTPVEFISWTFDEIFERADVIYNSPTIIEYFKKKGEILERKQSLKDKPRIAVIRGATDDNPTLDKNVIDERFSIYDDIDTTEMRRYGVFHQSTGAIFKDFSTNIHVIGREEHFSSGMPHDWVHARGVDFHEHTNWACGWIALSKQNEAFIYNEYNPSPDMMVTLEIAREIALRSKDCHFSINLVDPWMAKKQMNTGLSPLDDLNRAFYEFKREGLCIGGGYWQTWDTKSARGRDIIKERLKNSRLIGRPFANRIVNKGEERYLPTLWVLNNCTQTIHSFRNWRWQEWANRESLMTKDEKNKPQDKYSHFPITFECIFKHPAFSVSRYKTQFIKPRESVHAHYFQMR